jgi:phosphatidylserine decarboxylase
MDRSAWQFIIPGGTGILFIGVLFLLRHTPLLYGIEIFLILITGLLGYFFRDPVRPITNAGGRILSPADGRIIEITPPYGSVSAEESACRISIFLSIWNVHVNRIPVSGTIIRILYKKGCFLPAFMKHASDKNEMNSIEIQTDSGIIDVKQISGFLARRIVCRVKEGDSVQAGQRFGMIRFGSRVELVLPPCYNLKVQKGQRVKAGVSVLGEITVEKA